MCSERETARAAGQRAEAMAAAFLEAMGYTVLERNYAIRGGEIDIIAREGGVIAFVEVKARSSLRHGAPRESVTPRKQRRICLTALAWMQAAGQPDAIVRFDIVEITPQGPVLLRDAFAYQA